MIKFHVFWFIYFFTAAFAVWWAGVFGLMPNLTWPSDNLSPDFHERLLREWVPPLPCFSEPPTRSDVEWLRSDKSSAQITLLFPRNDKESDEKYTKRVEVYNQGKRLFWRKWLLDIWLWLVGLRLISFFLALFTYRRFRADWGPSEEYVEEVCRRLRDPQSKTVIDPLPGPSPIKPDTEPREESERPLNSSMLIVASLDATISEELRRGMDVALGKEQFQARSLMGELDRAKLLTDAKDCRGVILVCHADQDPQLDFVELIRQMPVDRTVVLLVDIHAMRESYGFKQERISHRLDRWRQQSKNAGVPDSRFAEFDETAASEQNWRDLSRKLWSMFEGAADRDAVSLSNVRIAGKFDGAKVPILDMVRQSSSTKSSFDQVELLRDTRVKIHRLYDEANLSANVSPLKDALVSLTDIAASSLATAADKVGESTRIVNAALQVTQTLERVWEGLPGAALWGSAGGLLIAAILSAVPTIGVAVAVSTSVPATVSLAAARLYQLLRSEGKLIVAEPTPDPRPGSEDPTDELFRAALLWTLVHELFGTTEEQLQTALRKLLSAVSAQPITNEAEAIEALNAVGNSIHRLASGGTVNAQ